MWQLDNYVLQVLQFDYPLCSGESIVNLHRQNEAIAVVAPSAHTINPHVHTIGEFNKGDVENKIISLQKKIEYIIINKLIFNNMSNYSYNYILEYIPSKYCGLSNKQHADRQAVYDFKDGHCSSTLREQMLNKIQSIISSNPSAWVVCFIPASTKAKQLKRYGTLCSYLNNQLACPVYIDGIDVAYDRESGHTSGKTGDPTANMVFNSSRFSGKKVILIDDVRTRGVTFERTADKLVTRGAVSVYGVFVAQTIHPNLPIDTTPRHRGGYYDEVLNDILAEEQYQDEIANEIMAEELYQDEIANEIMEEELYQEQAEMDYLYEIGELY